MQLPRPQHQEDLFRGVNALIDELEARFKAVDSDKLDGRDSVDFASAVGSLTSVKAKDADLLDGIDSLGFLKLLTVASRKVAFGSVTLTWAGATAVAATQTITHGLTPAPFVFVTCTATASGIWVAGVANAVGATTFQLNGYAQGAIPAAAQTATAYWLAIA